MALVLCSSLYLVSIRTTTFYGDQLESGKSGVKCSLETSDGISVSTLKLKKGPES